MGQELLKTRFCLDFHMNSHLLPRNSDNSIANYAFLYNYAAFLEERMGWVINQEGKLEPVLSHVSAFQFYAEKSMGTIFNRLRRCQAFLDGIMGCLPIEMSGVDFITCIALINILRESFQVYSSLSEGITALVDCSFEYKEPERALALKIFRRAYPLSYKLSEFFDLCKRIIGANSLEYPSVRIITKDCVSAIEESMSCSQTSGSRPSWTDLHSSISDVKRPTMVVDASGEANMDDEVVGEEPIGISGSPFSCKLETKISTAWVEFDKEDKQSSCLFVAGIGDQSAGFAYDIWIGDLEMKQEKSSGYYNPFVDLMDDDKHGDFMRG